MIRYRNINLCRFLEQLKNFGTDEQINDVQEHEEH